MKTLLQRVTEAQVTVDGEVVGAIQRGFLALVGIEEADTAKDLDWIARKLIGLRVFPDEAGKMNRSVVDVNGSILLVSQFTLCADVRKGMRPSFGRAMNPAEANAMFERLVARVGEQVAIETGRFQASMQVALVNDGPVTIMLDSRDRSSR